MTRRRVRKQWIFFYNVAALWRAMFLPRWVRMIQRKLCLRGWEKREDADEIRRRAEYYLGGEGGLLLPTIKERGATGVAGDDKGIGGDAKRLRDIRLRDSHSTYWYDLMRYLRGFSGDLRASFINGDTWENPEWLTFGKARRLDDRRGNVALMNLDRRRHFLRVKDPVPFMEKKGQLFFRGDVDAKENRRRFMERWWGNPLFDIGDTSPRMQTEWHKERVSIEDHFDYRYILALEGHDVASALQWIMASNSIPVMPRPTVEGWLMHGALEPGVHYIEIASDFSDVEEKIAYYNAHPEEGERIARASKEWAQRFENKRRENIIHYLVAEGYFGASGIAGAATASRGLRNRE